MPLAPSASESRDSSPRAQVSTHLPLHWEPRLPAAVWHPRICLRTLHKECFFGKAKTEKDFFKKYSLKLAFSYQKIKRHPLKQHRKPLFKKYQEKRPQKKTIVKASWSSKVSGSSSPGASLPHQAANQLDQRPGRPASSLDAPSRKTTGMESQP